jgi:hypothetical protein
VVAAYNVYFDIRFLDYEFRELGIKRSPPHFCLMYMRPMLGLGKRCSLEQACVEHGFTHTSAHMTSADCTAAAKLLLVYLREMAARSVRTFEDLASLKSYKFVSSFRRSPLEPHSGPAPENTAPLSPRGQRAAVAAPGARARRKAAPEDDSTRGLRAYWDALKEAVADLEMSDEELQHLQETRHGHHLSDRQVRAIHTKAFVSVLSRFTNDMELDSAETETVRRLWKCLSAAGWAPGEPERISSA